MSKKSKFSLGDRLLAKFASMPKSTAMEVGVDGLGLGVAQISSAQKRAGDLAKKGYLTQTDKRECGQTGKLVMEFKITSHGINYLDSIEITYSLRGGVAKLSSEVKPVAVVPDNPFPAPIPEIDKSAQLARLAGLKASLSQ